jgi:hypothetical protein
LEKLFPVFPGLSDAIVGVFIPLPRFGILSFQGFGMNFLILGEGRYQLGSGFLELVHNDSKRIMPNFRRSRQSLSDCVAGNDGMELFYLAVDGNLMAVPAKLGCSRSESFQSGLPGPLMPVPLSPAAFRFSAATP